MCQRGCAPCRGSSGGFSCLFCLLVVLRIPWLAAASLFLHRPSPLRISPCVFSYKNTARWFSCSVSKACLTLCNPMDCSIPGFPIFHYLLEFAQIHVHWVSDAIQPSHHLSPPSPSLSLGLGPTLNAGCFPGGSDGEKSANNTGHLGLISGLGRSPGGGYGYPLRYSCLENSMDRGACQATVQGVAGESDMTEAT